MQELKHDFQIDEIVYLMSGKKLFKGIVTDNRMFDSYVNVKWLNQDKGGGSPCYLSLHRTKDSAIQEWYNEEVKKLEKSHKRLLNSKV